MLKNIVYLTADIGTSRDRSVTEDVIRNTGSMPVHRVGRSGNGGRELEADKQSSNHDAKLKHRFTSGQKQKEQLEFITVPEKVHTKGNELNISAESVLSNSDEGPSSSEESLGFEMRATTRRSSNIIGREKRRIAVQDRRWRFDRKRRSVDVHGGESSLVQASTRTRNRRLVIVTTLPRL